MAAQFSGKVALVTGAGSGIGRASALAFARNGANVVIADVASQAGQETVRLIKELGSDAIFVRCDVARADEVEALVQRAVEAYGRLDYAHNNAGIEGGQALTADYEEAMWDRVFAVNLKGVWLCMKYELQQMLRQGGGAIVNTASSSGLVGARGLPAYVASKHGVVGITRAAALEYARDNIRVNCICPSTIQTAMMERITGSNPHMLEQFAESQPLGRIGEPDEVAAAVVWLCSESATLVTGHALSVDGGRLAQ